MKLEVRYATHPEDSKRYTTEELRKHYLIESIFVSDEVNLVYSHFDRIIAGGVMPVNKTLKLEGGKELAADYFLQRRELGVINIGGDGAIIIDGTEYQMNARDGIYIGMGYKDIEFISKDSKNPAKFYVNSATAHTTYPIKKIAFEDSRKVSIGSQENANERVINQYIHPDVCDSCQLAMGMTTLSPGSMWNTMPCHTHDRRMEVYLYFDMDEETRVFHLMGPGDETRHIVMSNEQAVISPSWSIHSGVGTKNYTFIWGMVGENKTFTDMDHIAMQDLK